MVTSESFGGNSAVPRGAEEAATEETVRLQGKADTPTTNLRDEEMTTLQRLERAHPREQERATVTRCTDDYNSES